MDKLAAFKSRDSGHNIPQKEAAQLMAKEISQLMQSWLPTQPVADASSQQRILELEAELAKVKSASGHVAPAPSETPGTSSTPIGRALQRQQAPSTTFDPSCLLVSPGSVNP